MAGARLAGDAGHAWPGHAMGSLKAGELRGAWDGGLTVSVRRVGVERQGTRADRGGQGVTDRGVNVYAIQERAGYLVI